MSRFIRLYEKKRGDRRTGSQAFASIGEALFFGFFLVLGCLAFGFMWVGLVWPEWRANRQFIETPCEVLDAKVGFKAADQAASYRPELRIRYTVSDRTYVQDQVYEVTQLYADTKSEAQTIVDSFEIGKEYPCWYDPLDPARVVLTRGYSGWLYLFLLIPISFIIIGTGGLVFTLLHRNTSAERRDQLTQRAAELNPFTRDDGDNSFPTVPTDANLTNSPGTTLAYRLPIATTTGWTLFAASAACVVWNAIVLFFVVMVVRGFTRGEPSWMLTVVISPFVIAGIALIVYLLRQVVIATGVGPTRIEISDHPLSPGEPYDLFLSQAGRLAMNSLEVWLACDEKATYRQGTDTRTESRRVYEQRCFVREKFDIHQGMPFESRLQVRVPETAMHSFHAHHNEVSWKLIVKGSVVGWPDYQRVFQIVVNPATNGHVRR